MRLTLDPSDHLSQSKLCYLDEPRHILRAKDFSSRLLFEPSFIRRKRCELFASYALRFWKADVMVNSLSAMNTPPDLFCVKSTDNYMEGGYCPDTHTVFMCTSPLFSMKSWNFFHFRRVLTENLVIAFDYSRAYIHGKFDAKVCSVIRSKNLSGLCELWTRFFEDFKKDPFAQRMQNQRQRCIRQSVSDDFLVHNDQESIGDRNIFSDESHVSYRVNKSNKIADVPMNGTILSDVSRKQNSIHSSNNDFNSADNIQSHTVTEHEFNNVLDRVWDRCYKDYLPFTTLPEIDTRFRPSPMRSNQ